MLELACIGQDREKAGRCICDLVFDTAAVSPLSEQSAKDTPGQVVKHKLLYTFTRAPRRLLEHDSSTDALNEKGFTEGDMVILSIEGRALCIGCAAACRLMHALTDLDSLLAQAKWQKPHTDLGLLQT